MDNAPEPAQRPPTLPLDTHVVTRVPAQGTAGGDRPAGMVGVVVAAPEAAEPRYRVRFADGDAALLARRDLTIRKGVARQGLRDAGARAEGPPLDTYVILRCVVGSRAYGLDSPDSDTDRRGIYLPPADLHWSLAGVPEQLEHEATQECYWELQTFLTLALKANPNVLECLYTPLIEQATPLAQELLAMRDIFLSRLVYQTYNGYVLSQFKQIEIDLRSTGGIKWKHAMHLIRLLLSGIAVLRDGFVAVRLEEHRDRLLAIRRGETTWEAVDAWRLRLHGEFDATLGVTRLPDHPDYRRADAFLRRARRSMVTA